MAGWSGHGRALRPLGSDVGEAPHRLHCRTHTNERHQFRPLDAVHFPPFYLHLASYKSLFRHSSPAFQLATPSSLHPFLPTNCIWLSSASAHIPQPVVRHVSFIKTLRGSPFRPSRPLLSLTPRLHSAPLDGIPQAGRGEGARAHRTQEAPGCRQGIRASVQLQTSDGRRDFLGHVE
jgi:hypothetical protein